MFVKVHIGHTQSWFSVELRPSRELANQVQLKSEMIWAILSATPWYHKIITLSQWLSPSSTPSIRSFSPSQTGNYLISKCFPRWSSFDHPPCCRPAPGLHQQHQDFDQQLSRQAHHDITQQDRCLPDSCKTVQRNSRKQNIANSCAQQRLSL